MVCHNPYFKEHEGELLELQCGKCPRCKIRRVNQWIFRIKRELDSSLSANFITLTYAPKFLPKTNRGLGTLRKTDVQNFIKRLREFEKSDGNPKIIKYFAAGEYGDETKRPHYHIVLLNVSSIKNIENAWKRKKKKIGNIDYGQVNQKTIAYTIKYIDKECYIGYHRSDQRERQFQLMSKGLGYNYLTEQQIQFHRNNPLRNYVQLHDGMKVGMPRYYAKHIWSTEALSKKRRDILVPYLEDRYRKIKQKYETKYKHNTYEDYLNLKMQKEKRRFGKNINDHKRNKI